MFVLICVGVINRVDDEEGGWGRERVKEREREGEKEKERERERNKIYVCKISLCN